MGNVRMCADQINYGATSVKVALDELGPKDLIELSERMDKIEAWKDTVEETTVSGAEAVFTNALALPALAIISDIEPIQDLHGYDKPWVGGADVNKGDFTDGYNLGVDGLPYAYEGRCATVNPITIVADTAYYVTKFGTGTGFIYSVFDSEDALVRRETATSGSALNVSGGAYFYICAYDGTISDIQPMLTIGSVPTAYSPYSNICPISGRTEARVDDAGQNLFSKVFVDDSHYLKNDGTIASDSNFHITEFIPVSANTNYILSGVSGNNSPSICVYDANQNFLFGEAYSNRADVTINTGASGRFVKFSVRNDIVNTVMFEQGTQKSPSYIPYTGNVNVTIQLGTTVYGGQVDFKTGRVRVTKGYKKVSDLTWSPQASSYAKFVAPIENLKYVNDETTIISDIYKSYSNANKPASVDGVYVGGATPDNLIKVYDSAYPNTTDLDAWKTARANNMFCYELATPTELTLTPSQLTMLKGYNRLSSDSGDIEVTAYTGAAWGGDEA